ncbi:MAG: M28 family metallopeptidase [Holophaga sp.]|jgi:hypothetical protein
MRVLAVGLALLLALPLAAQEQPPSVVRDLAGKVESAHLTRTVGRLASFGTRHTLSDPLAEHRGIGAARRWLAGEFQAIARQPGSRLVAFEDAFQAGPDPLLPRRVELANLGALLPGVDPSRAREALVVAAHYDSRAQDPLDANSDAPGAVDNASGVALVLEMATVMAVERPAVGIYFVATAAGEQGNLGSVRLAGRLKAEGIEVLAMVAADCVGNTALPGGAKANESMRLFSPGLPAQETEGERRVRELLGSENDGPSRALARYIKRMGEHYVEGFEAMVMLRQDRVGFTGEHLVFDQQGWPAVRVTDAVDNFDRLRRNVHSETGRAYGDTPAFFDAGYCAKITRMLVVSFRHLAFAPPPPQNVGLGGCGTPDARLFWMLPDDPRITGVVIYHRRADTVQWQQTRAFPKSESQVIPGLGTDSDVFAVATLDAQGDESLPVSPRSVAF